MKKLLVMVTILVITSSSAFAQFMNTQPQTTTSNTSSVVHNNGAGEKSPALAGLLSFIIPGGGQFYNGESSKAWMDLGTQVGCVVLASVGSSIATKAAINGNGTMSIVGLAVSGISGICALVNGITSITDAVKSAKRINFENGYAFIETENGTQLGLSPSVVSTSLAFNDSSNLNIAPGMKFSVRF